MMVKEPLQFADVAGCRAWLAGLPLANPAHCHAPLAAQARRLLTGAIAPAAMLDILELLREPVAQAQAVLVKDCRGKPVPLDAATRKTWERAVGLWQSMASGYDSLIDAMAGSAPDLALQAHLICQRALRYTGLAMFEHCHVYHEVDGALWRQLHRLYVFSENSGVTGATVSDSIGRQTAATTCAATYAHALLLHLAQPDALTCEQLDIVDGWLDRWEGQLRLSLEPLAQSKIPALAVDLASQRGAELERHMPAAGVRHLNLDDLSETVRKAAAALKSQAPEQLGLGALPRNACEKLLQQLHIQWCAAGTGRHDERSPVSIKVKISPSLNSMHFHLTGKAFRQPAAELTAAERQRLDMWGSVAAADEKALVSQSSGALETWVIVNQSVSGFLGTAKEKEVASRISHLQLVGLQPTAKKVMYLGIVRRLTVDAAGTIWIGLRIILGAPLAVAVRAADGAGKHERALLMPEDAARKIPASIVLLPGWYQANRLLHVHGGKESRVKLQALLDQGSNFERATYAAG